VTHLTDKQIECMLTGALPPQAQAELLEHALACDDCAALLWQANADLPEIAPPPGFETHVLERTRTAKPKQESLRSYALRVFAAMAAALILLLSGAFQRLEFLPRDLPKLGDSIRTQFTEFIDMTKEGLNFASEPK